METLFERLALALALGLTVSDALKRLAEEADALTALRRWGRAARR